MDIDQRWIWMAAAIALGVFLLDEFAYKFWKVNNPGSLYTGVAGESWPTYRPPYTIQWESYATG